jgi:hypothetical protein
MSFLLDGGFRPPQGRRLFLSLHFAKKSAEWTAEQKKCLERTPEFNLA